MPGCDAASGRPTFTFDAIGTRWELVPVATAGRERALGRGRARWATDIVGDGVALITRRPVVIDVGAVGKGYLGDGVSEILRSADVKWFVIDAGEFLRYVGRSGVRVGLERADCTTSSTAGLAGQRTERSRPG